MHAPTPVSVYNARKHDIGAGALGKSRSMTPATLRNLAAARRTAPARPSTAGCTRGPAALVADAAAAAAAARRPRARPSTAPVSRGRRPTEWPAHSQKLHATSTVLLAPHTLRSRQIAERAYPQVYGRGGSQRRFMRGAMTPDRAATVIQSSHRGNVGRRQASKKALFR